MPRRGLGKGLEALIPGEFESTATAGDVLQVSIDKIKPNPRQPRIFNNDAGLQELADSIREHGILQPLMLTRDEAEDGYTLIAGERRLRAAQIAGLDSVPALVRLATDQQRLEIAVIENIQREDLSPLEAAEAYQQLNDEFGLSHDEIALRLGKSRTAITNTIRLLKLPEPARQALGEGNISEGHARALLGLTTQQAQLAGLDTIIRHDLTVRQSEELVRKMTGRKPQAPAKEKKDAKSSQLQALEDQLRDHLGTRVNLNHSAKGGTLIIHFYSDEELDELVERILNA
jgi:ParB family chromosome partitioning protein